MDYKLKHAVILILLILCQLKSFSQDLGVGIGYSYLYAKQWDKAIQTYNLSRPFMIQKQPLIENGFNLYSSYLFRSGRHLKHGIFCAYSYFSSSSTNVNLSNKLQLHQIKPGYMMHYEPIGPLKYLSIDIHISAPVGGLFRRVNNKPYFYDDKRAEAFGIGGCMDIKCAYQLIKINKRLTLSPYINAGFTPYFYTPGFESIINQTKQLTSNTSTTIANLDLGLTFTRK